MNTSDTSGGATDVINQYLKPLNLTKTYYSFDKINVHFTIIDPYIDYGSTSDQYQFIKNDKYYFNKNNLLSRNYCLTLYPHFLILC
ncbi:MAG TPA: hypothetical protein VFK40_04690 [Nitrososphaeraceae archaeon]|nr:hypothetical protein [Nitrososphaeraceae archaeon]